VTALKADFPTRIIAVIEQCPGDIDRMEYEPKTGRFVPNGFGYLHSQRGYRGAYGWIAGLGTPPQPHVDVLILTQRTDLVHGQQLAATICGIFWRADGDHKLIAVTDEVLKDCACADWDSLPLSWRNQLERIYPHLEPGEGWLGSNQAQDYLLRCRNSAEHIIKRR